MKIIDCFMYFDEDVVLDLRLNYLNNYVDKFVIVESKYAHNGKKRNLNFNINNFKKFENKIIYLVLDHEPPGIENINDKDHIDITNGKYILNSMKRDYYQRNFIINGLKDCENEDFILINVYVPNSQSLKCERYYFRERWNVNFLCYILFFLSTNN